MKRVKDEFLRLCFDYRWLNKATTKKLVVKYLGSTVYLDQLIEIDRPVRIDPIFRYQ